MYQSIFGTKPQVMIAMFGQIPTAWGSRIHIKEIHSRIKGIVEDRINVGVTITIPNDDTYLSLLQRTMKLIE